MRTVLLALGIAVAIWLAAVLFLLLAGKRSAARELVSLLPNLLALFRGLIRDPRVPKGTKLWIGFAIAWFLSPIDLVPEFIPVAGPLDDAIVAALVLGMCSDGPAATWSSRTGEATRPRCECS